MEMLPVLIGFILFVVFNGYRVFLTRTVVKFIIFCSPFIPLFSLAFGSLHLGLGGYFLLVACLITLKYPKKVLPRYSEEYILNNAILVTIWMISNLNVSHWIVFLLPGAIILTYMFNTISAVFLKSPNNHSRAVLDSILLNSILSGLALIPVAYSLIENYERDNLLSIVVAGYGAFLAAEAAVALVTATLVSKHLRSFFYDKWSIQFQEQTSRHIKPARGFIVLFSQLLLFFGFSYIDNTETAFYLSLILNFLISLALTGSIKSLLIGLVYRKASA